MGQPQNLSYSQYIEQAKADYSRARDLFKRQQYRVALPALQEGLEKLLRAQIASQYPHSYAAAMASWPDLLLAMQNAGIDDQTMREVSRVNELIIRLREDSTPPLEAASIQTYAATVQKLFRRFLPGEVATPAAGSIVQPVGATISQPVSEPATVSMHESAAQPAARLNRPTPPDPLPATAPASRRVETGSFSRTTTGPLRPADAPPPRSAASLPTLQAERTATSQRQDGQSYAPDRPPPPVPPGTKLPKPTGEQPKATGPLAFIRNRTGSMAQPQPQPPRTANQSRSQRIASQPLPERRAATVGSTHQHATAAEHHAERWVWRILLFVLGIILVVVVGAALGLMGSVLAALLFIVVGAVVGFALSFMLAERMSSL